jgi:predicted nucleotidyltransferase
MESIQQILTRLNNHGVEFVIIGGVAAILHGAARLTLDVDVCASLAEPNLSKILTALRGTHPRWRMHPNKPPLPDDPARLQGFRHLYLDTDIGILDVLTEVTGIGCVDDVLRHSTTLDVGGIRFRVLDLDTLIASKKAAGRKKDLEAVKELELIREKLRGGGHGNQPGGEHER